MISDTVVSLNDTPIHKLRDIKLVLLLLQLSVSGILQNVGLNLNAFTEKEKGARGQERDAHSFYCNIQFGLSNGHIKYLPVY